MERIEKRLLDKVKKAKANESLRKAKPEIDDIFERAGYLAPQNFNILNYAREPRAVFNPGVSFNGKVIQIYPRFAFDYYGYVASIGKSEGINIERLISGNFHEQIDTEIILCPDVDKEERWDFKGYEDPRIFSQNETTFILSTGNVGRGVADDEFSRRVGAVLAFAKFKGRELKQKEYFKIRGKNDQNFVPEWHKDAAFININNNKANMLVRLSIHGCDGGCEECWSGKADLNDMTISENSLQMILSSVPDETKVGWSTQTVPVSNNEYLIGWHAVRKNLSYANGLAVINVEGDLLAITPDYVLAPQKSNITECLGDRPLVIFGCGLIIHKDKLIWIGGVSDWAIGIFIADLETAMSKLRWIKG